MPGAAITWFGHACVLFELDGARLLTDPLLRRRAADPPLSIPRSEELAGLDVVLISRVHYDHLDLPSLDLLPRQTPLVTPRGVGPLLREHGFLDVTELVAGEALEVNGVGVRAMHAEDRPRHGPIAASAPSLGFLLGGTETIYFAGATGVYRRSPEPGRRLDVAVLPVAGEARQPPPRHLEPDSAVDALRVLRPRFAVPISGGRSAHFTRTPRRRGRPIRGSASPAARASSRPTWTSPSWRRRALGRGRSARGVHPNGAMKRPLGVGMLGRAVPGRGSAVRPAERASEALHGRPCSRRRGADQ